MDMICGFNEEICYQMVQSRFGKVTAKTHHNRYEWNQKTEHRGWVDNMFRIREVHGSNLGLETGYPDWRFSWFSTVLPGTFRNIALNLGHDRFLPRPFQFIIHLFIRRCIISNYWKKRRQINFYYNYNKQAKLMVAQLVKKSHIL
jgi:hypothetical protein